MQAAPERPRPVPERARWSADRESWELLERDAEGKPDGPYQAFHPNGDLLEEGTYVHGLLDGAVVRHVSRGPGGKPLRSCCVPPGAARLRADYDEGHYIREIFYDAEGRALGSDGKPWPERPASVSDSAEFEERSGRWRVRIKLEPPEAKRELLRFFDREGNLLQEIETRAGKQHVLRLFDQGGLREELHQDAEGKLHGPYYCRYQEGQSPYQDPRIVEERGALEGGQMVGPFSFFDRAGKVVSRRERGRAFSDQDRDASPAFSRGDEDFLALSTTLLEEGRTREALVAAARGAARAGEATPLRATMERLVEPLVREASLERARRHSEGVTGSLSTLLDSWLGGAEPALLLRTLVGSVPTIHPAARDFVEASLLLAPGEPTTHVTRALLRIELGDREGALEDTEEVARGSEPAAAYLRDFHRLLFPSFGFAPELEALDEPAGELAEVEIDQPLAAVRRGVMLYATRLLCLRQAIAAQVPGEPSFLPPDPSFLLPDGPIELEKIKATITDETEDGVESSEVEIDETLDLSGRSPGDLVRSARAHHGALGWLCWSVGLDRVALPESITPRPTFTRAVNQALVRAWRASDRLKTGGLLARSRKLPGFSWEQMDIDSMPKGFAEIAATEYLERRAMFIWLMFSQNLSPFQDDLRRA